MSETTLEDSVAPGKKRRGPLFWVLSSCGCGCFLLVAAFVLAGIFLWREVEEGMDPEKAWGRVGEVLPFDERPADMKAFVWDWFGPEQIQIFNGLRATILLLGLPEDVEQAYFAKDGIQTALRGDAEYGSIELQGREVRAVWFEAVPEVPGLDKLPGFKEIEAASQAIGLDLSSDTRGIFLMIQRQAQNEHQGERIEAEEVQSFLEPFDLWRGR